MSVGCVVIFIEIRVGLQHTISAPLFDELVVVDERGLTREEGEGNRPVVTFVFERESRGEVGRSEEVRHKGLRLVFPYAFILIASPKLCLEVGRKAGTPSLVGIP